MHHSRFPAERLAAERRDSVSVCVPVLNEAATIEDVMLNLAGMLVLYALQRLQGFLPLNPADLGALSPDSSRWRCCSGIPCRPTAGLPTTTTGWTRRP